MPPASESHPTSPRVAVILTVLNEAESVAGVLDSLLAQTRLPDEVIVVDGGSTDGTPAMVEAYRDRLPLQLIVRPGANISEGRNAAIRATQADIIASTDAGVRLAPTWLEDLLAPWQEGTPSVSAGFFLPDPQTPFEVALAATTLPLLEEIRPEHFLPSSRSVAFTREAWSRVGGYPEWLDYSEDIVFDLRLRGLTGPFAWAPSAIAYFRPRRSLRSFFRQYRHYAFGDGQADLWRLRHTVRYLTYGGGLPALVVAAWKVHPLFWGILLLGLLLYCRRPWWRLIRLMPVYSCRTRVRLFLWVPVLRAVGDLAKMVGYPQGLWWRFHHRHDSRVHWRRDLPPDVGGTSGGRVL